MNRSLEGLLNSNSLLNVKDRATPVARSTFEEIVTTAFHQFHDLLYRHSLLLTWSASDSEEITQESFLKLYQQLLEGKRIDNIRAWLFRVVRNAAIDRGRGTRELDSLSESGNVRSAEEKLSERVPSPESILLRRERESLLSNAIDRLPELQRHCLYLRKEGLSYREIAFVLSIGETTVVDNLTRAITKLNREVHAQTNS